MFHDLANHLNEQGASVRAYEACARDARARVKTEPEHAAALLLLAHTAHLFADSYDDQPLTVQAAREEFERFTGFAKMLDEAYADGGSDKKLAALNSVASGIVAAMEG